MQDQNMTGLIRGSVTGTVAQNADCRIEKLSKAGSIKQQHLKAMVSIAKYIVDNGMIVLTQDVAKKYRELKGLKGSNRIESARLLETISKHLNVIQVYIRGRDYIIENHGPDVIKLVNSLENLTITDQTRDPRIVQSFKRKCKVAPVYLKIAVHASGLGLL